MPNSTIETSLVETQPNAEIFESLDLLVDQPPQIDVPVGQIVVAQEVVTESVSPIEQYLDILAKSAATERFSSQNAMRDLDSAPVDHDANQSFFEGINFTRCSHNSREEIMFRAAVDFHYAALVNPSA